MWTGCWRSWSGGRRRSSGSSECHPCCIVCFVFVEARRRCGRDAGGAGVVVGGDPQVALSATPEASCVLCL